MTTTVAFATRDCVVIGCDSLATTSVPLLNPERVLEKYFEPEERDFALRLDDDGNPILESFADLYSLIDYYPYNQLPSVTKAYSLYPAHAGLLFAGASVIGTQSIKQLVRQFVNDRGGNWKTSNYDLRDIAENLSDFLSAPYDDAYGERPLKPPVEVILAGYSRGTSGGPEIWKIEFDERGNKMINESRSRGEYGFVFGGQHDVIERVVLGMDFANYTRHKHHVRGLLEQCRQKVVEHLEEQEITVELPEIDDLDLDTGELGWLRGLYTPSADFSEQAAIDFVDFLVEIMIQAQRFSNRLPTVGGEIHVALITKNDGFKWISREAYTYRGRYVPKHDD